MSAIERFFVRRKLQGELKKRESGPHDSRKEVEKDSLEASGGEQTQASAAFRKLYQAISEVSQAVAELSIPDEEMYHLMAKMDQLNDAFSSLRRVHSQGSGSSASSFNAPSLREETNRRTDSFWMTAPPSYSRKAKSLSLEEKLNTFAAEATQTKQEIERIKSQHKSDIKTIASNVALLTNDQKDILRRLTLTEEKVETFVRLQALLNKLHLNVKDRETLKSEVDQMNIDLIKITDTVETMQSVLLDHTVGCSGDKHLVGFHAWAESTMQNYVIDQTIGFTRILLNTSNCYDATTSTFTAPMDGMYFFSSSISLCSKVLFTAVIVRNDKEELALFAAPPLQDLQTSTSALAALTKGDKVRVKVYQLNSPKGAIPGGGFSSFLGFLIR